ncbi:hypothetical protein EYF80_054222 [Liparis tanakae]|uniref:Uncharacterized protein n=1 Tax=Liparis tanakae TaxID=230148 RepID=A0A4Z2F3J0_9TELE|nr:hypothetical protein EYF80_054222 [Liparis tanakae]
MRCLKRWGKKRSPRGVPCLSSGSAASRGASARNDGPDDGSDDGRSEQELNDSASSSAALSGEMTAAHTQQIAPSRGHRALTSLTPPAAHRRAAAALGRREREEPRDGRLARARKAPLSGTHERQAQNTRPRRQPGDHRHLGYLTILDN